MGVEMVMGAERGSDLMIHRSSCKIFLIGHLPKLHSLSHKAVA